MAKTCPDCATDVLDSASECPTCGGRRRIDGRFDSFTVKRPVPGSFQVGEQRPGRGRRRRPLLDSRPADPDRAQKVGCLLDGCAGVDCCFGLVLLVAAAVAIAFVVVFLSGGRSRPGGPGQRS